jgi:hypothetical protein
MGLPTRETEEFRFVRSVLLHEIQLGLTQLGTPAPLLSRPPSPQLPLKAIRAPLARVQVLVLVRQRRAHVHGNDLLRGNAISCVCDCVCNRLSRLKGTKQMLSF